MGPSRRGAAATTLTIARNTASRRTISRVALIGRRIALTPMTNAIVTTVEASALPRARSALPSSPATALTRSSGSAEIVETRSAPTTKRLLPILPAKPAALSVMNFAPWFSTMKPMPIAPTDRSASSVGILSRIPSDGRREGGRSTSTLAHDARLDNEPRTPQDEDSAATHARTSRTPAPPREECKDHRDRCTAPRAERGYEPGPSLPFALGHLHDDPGRIQDRAPCSKAKVT